jgi:hydroxyacylglutathione hydrolase
VSGVRITTVPVGPLLCNCTILVDEATGDAVVIDPGDEPERILAAVESAQARPVALLHTHGHFDHIGAASDVGRATGALLRIHDADRFLWDALPEQATLFGFAAKPLPAPDGAFRDGETIPFGRSSVRAIHTPGHTPGSTCFLLETDEPVLFSGDTLFRRSIGRTDLWGGDSDQILVSIRKRLFVLPEGTPVVCGHGPATTIGEEKTSNPFVGE